ncbi:MAG: TIGR03067 domain-containing protein [Planctomycetaceae bacterium]
MSLAQCHVLVLVVASCVVVTGTAYAEEDESSLLGTWDYVSVTYDGKPFYVGNSATITITPTEWTIRRNGEVINSTWKVDSTKKPKWLTQAVRRGELKFTMNSIYRFENGRLFICECDHPDKPRPVRFSASQGDGQFLIVLQRRADE